MKTALIALLATMVMINAMLPAYADAPASQTPTLEVSATGSVDYVPDTATTNFTVRGVAGTAADAAMLLSTHAHSVIDALRRLGIGSGDIKTTNYNLSYQPPEVQPMQGAAAVPAAAATAAPKAAGVKAPMPVRCYPCPPGPYYYGAYVASETIGVRSSVARAGAVIDAAIRAGADQSYGIGYDSTQRDRLYRAALERAVANARQQADAIAAAARVTITGVLSISTAGAPRPILYGAVRAMAAPAPTTPVEAGTDTITATVDVVFRIR
jgi:uncharacterized protein